MKLLPIVTIDDPHLRDATHNIHDFSTEFTDLIEAMRTTMHHAKGVGLAAPQIGEAKKLAVIEYDPARFDETDEHEQSIPFFVIANPVITSYGPKIEVLEEGCLSVPQAIVKVPRALEVNVLAHNERGERFRIRARGFLARILQHEIDHLQGKLIVDYLSPKARKKYES